MFNWLSPPGLRLAARMSCTSPSRVLMRLAQDFLLRRTLRHAGRHSPIYVEKFRAAGVSRHGVRYVRDLGQLGFFTLPEELGCNPQAFLSVPRRDVRFVTATSGASGQPKLTFFTAGEWSQAVAAGAWGLGISGVGPGDVVQILFCFGKPAWMTGHLAMDTFGAAGATVIPAGNSESTATQLGMMRTFGTTVLIGTPSYLWRLTEEGGKLTDLHALGIKQIRCGAERLTTHVRALLKDAWGAEIYDSYGTMETGGLVGGECHRHNGFHTSPAYAVEVVDPAGSKPLARGQTGELVITTLGRTATPLLRYRTGDLGFLLDGPECGCHEFPTERIGGIVGRVDEMIILGSGENFFPERFEAAIRTVPGIQGFQIVVDKHGFRDRIRVRVETDQGGQISTHDVATLMLQGLPELRTEIESSGTVDPLNVELLTPGTLHHESPVKVRRLLDLRPQ